MTAPAPVRRRVTEHRAWGEVAVVAGFSAVYALAAAIGQTTVLAGTDVSLVWSAAGVAAVWFTARATLTDPLG